MECQNEFCLYQQNSECLVESIDVDEFGICSTCILVNIPEDILSKLKQEQLENLENERKKWDVELK